MIGFAKFLWEGLQPRCFPLRSPCRSKDIGAEPFLQRPRRRAKSVILNCNSASRVLWLHPEGE
ncbi:hypothetical protein [Lysobacter gummosus]|uniref:hypothetical protein n=1 Tax=Lysobacter gummosus TaxID=262324 RepID=UPI00364533F3